MTFRIGGRMPQEILLEDPENETVVDASRLAMGHFALDGGRKATPEEKRILANYDRRDDATLTQLSKKRPRLAAALYLIWKVPSGVPFVQALASGEQLKRQINSLGWGKYLPKRQRKAS